VTKPKDNERKNKIINHVVTNGHAKVNELAELLNVTTETIRKDLAYLQEKNILENSFAVKEGEHAEAKTQIAQLASTLIPQNGVVFLDSGTTVVQLAKLLNLRSDLTIVTNSMIAAQMLQNTGNQLLVTGGELRQASFSYVGNWARKALNNIRVDVAFLSCDGFHEEGPSIRSFRELDIKEAAIQSAKQSILLADSSKLTKTGMYCFSPFSSFNTLILERELKTEEKLFLPDSLLISHP